MAGELGRGRAATLALMGEMITQNVARVPGHRNANTVMGRGRGLTDQIPSYPTSGVGRAKVRNPVPHPYSEPPLCPSYTKPQCLIRDPLENLPSSPCSPDHSDSSLENSDSRPPSLESITDSIPQSQGMRPQIQPQTQIKSPVLCFVKLFT